MSDDSDDHLNNLDDTAKHLLSVCIMERKPTPGDALHVTATLAGLIMRESNRPWDQKMWDELGILAEARSKFSF